MATQVKTAKTVTVLARYSIKATQTVIYNVRNGGDREYIVGLHKSGHTTCTCEHGQHAGNAAHCYHVTNCQAKELARREAIETANCNRGIFYAAY